MIVNISERTQADNEFLVQSILTALMKSRKQFRSRVIGLIISVMLLAAAAAFVWLIVTAPRYHKKADFSIYAWLVVCTVLGVYGLVTWLFAKQITYRSTIRSKEWKSVIGMPVKTVFDGGTVTTFRSADGADTQTTYALNLIESFTDRGNTLYLCVTADNQKKYIILHDDGYPEGLRGEQIPLEARIMAIADVYDALVSKRVYKDSMSFAQADSIILEGMGKHFDQRLEPYYIAARPRLEAYYSEVLHDADSTPATKGTTEA